MNIFANGCSYTFGGGLYNLVDQEKLVDSNNSDDNTNKERLNTTWPGRLAKRLKSDNFKNYALSCGSNDRIVRTSIEFYRNLLSQGKSVTNWYAVIQLTYSERFEFFDNNNQSWSLVKHNRYIRGDGTLYPQEDQSRLQNYYRYNNKTYWEQKTLNQIMTLGHFFCFHNIPYIFWSMYSDQLLLSKDGKKYCNKYFNWLHEDIDHFPKVQKLSCGHPTRKGHEELAKIIHRGLNI